MFQGADPYRGFILAGYRSILGRSGVKLGLYEALGIWGAGWYFSGRGA